MIQFNLLPEVKIQFIKAKRLKRIIMVICGLLSAASVAIFAIVFITVASQGAHIENLNKDIKTELSTLQSTKDLDKVLTIQNQLLSLPALHEKKPLASRLFAYITQVTPSEITISSFDIDYDTNIITIDGSAQASDGKNNLSVVNKFVDTIKFTTYKIEGSETQEKAFKDVILTSSSRQEKGSSYSISLKFEPIIFDANQKIVLVVPQQQSTRSFTEKPTELFKKTEIPTAEGLR